MKELIFTKQLQKQIANNYRKVRQPLLYSQRIQFIVSYKKCNPTSRTINMHVGLHVVRSGAGASQFPRLQQAQAHPTSNARGIPDTENYLVTSSKLQGKNTFDQLHFLGKYVQCSIPTCARVHVCTFTVHIESAGKPSLYHEKRSLHRPIQLKV